MFISLPNLVTKHEIIVCPPYCLTSSSLIYGSRICVMEGTPFSMKYLKSFFIFSSNINSVIGIKPSSAISMILWVLLSFKELTH